MKSKAQNQLSLFEEPAPPEAAASEAVITHPFGATPSLRDQHLEQIARDFLAIREEREQLGADPFWIAFFERRIDMHKEIIYGMH